MRKAMGVVLCCILLMFLAGCGSGGSGSSGLSDTESASARISASGGSLTTPGGIASLNVPAGALSEDKSITVSPNSKVTPPGNIAGAFDYGPDGQTFSSPVTVSIKYDPDLMPIGMSASDLRLAWLAGNGIWEIIPGSTVDTANNLVSGQTSHFSTYTVIVHERKPFGEQTGSFNSVIAYSNGTTGYTSGEYNSHDSYNTGMKWLCDEYVNRYYKQVYDQEIRIEGRKANDYYQNAAARGLTAYPNDGSEQPQAGDILVSEYGDYGHVAIVREVQDNKIFVIQQNWSDNGADDRYPITRKGNHVYPFDGKKGHYAIKGWLRCDHHPAYSISGQVTYQSAGLSGVTVTLTGTTTASATTDASGNYSFSNANNGNYTITASKTGYSFNPTSISATIYNANLTDQDFTASANTYTISGKVSGDIVSGVTITLTGTGSSTTTTDSGGNYRFTGAVEGNYTVTPSFAGYTFSPVSKVVTVEGANETGINFTSTTNIEPTYTVSGKISGDVQGGVIVTLTGKSTSSTTTDGSGNYSFSGLTNGNYTITPSKTNYTFSPTGRSVTISGANITGQDFTATENTYTISGTVSGAVVSGVTITLTGSGSATTTTDTSGNYTFSGAKNGSYTITTSKTGYTFSPASISATVNSANLTGQNFTSTENTYTVAGTVSGDVLSGVTITLTGSGSVSTTTDSSGNYIFTGAKNGSYTIAASKTGYTFSPVSISATVNFADLTGQNFTATENTYSISGTVSGAVASGVTITLMGTGSTSTTTDGSGNYSFTGAKNGSYTIAASKTGYTFSPASISATVSFTDLTGQNFTAAAASDKSMTEFSLNGVAGTINEAVKTIVINMPCDTDVSSLIATFNISGISVKVGSTIQISGSSTNDFTSSVVYTVTAADNSTVNYTVTVSTRLDMSFNPNADNEVSCIALQPDGKILIGGYFTTVGGVARNHIARLNADGTLDTEFDAGAMTNSDTRPITVYSIAVQADGKILIGGVFNSINSVARNNVARLNANGTIDTGFNPNVQYTGSTCSVFSIVTQADGKILIGGNFNSVGGTTRHKIARINSDGSLEAGFNPNNPNTAGPVYAIFVQNDGKILLGGNFGSIGGNTCNRIIRLNSTGTVDTTFSAANVGITIPNSIVVQSDGKILAGGYANVIARLNANGTVDTGFSHTVNGWVLSIAVQSDGQIIMGGTFTTVDGVNRNRLARFNADGSLDTGFNPNISNAIRSIALQSDGKILIGGSFSTIGVVPRNNVARLLRCE